MVSSHVSVLGVSASHKCFKLEPWGRKGGGVGGGGGGGGGKSEREKEGEDRPAKGRWWIDLNLHVVSLHECLLVHHCSSWTEIMLIDVISVE